MSARVSVAGTAALAAIITISTPVGPTVASTPGLSLGREVRACLRAIQTPRHSADVVQAWIDGCRRDARSRRS